MQDKEVALLDAVKVAVARYGISGISTRMVGDISGVNDAYIYRFFKNKEEMLFEAYKRENGAIFKKILFEIDTNHLLEVDFASKSYKCFINTWDFLLQDKERLAFCVRYYHSVYFESAQAYHANQLNQLTEKLGQFFKSEADCKFVMYAICSILYDSSYAVILGREENNPEYTHRVFKTLHSVLTAMN